MRRYWLMFSALIALLSLPSVSLAQDPQFTNSTLLPAPTGPYQIGRTSRHWVDESRNETFTEDADDHREIVVTIWYPADVAMDAAPALYFADISGSMGSEALAILLIETWVALVPDIGIEAQDPAAHELGRSTTYSFADAPVSTAQPSYPVLVFSPGFGGMPEEYTVQIEELASHGYIVVGINHPYYSGVTLFPDGHTATVADFPSTRTEQRQAQTIPASDFIFTLDELEILNTNDPAGVFTGRLDLARIGVFGHSLGGAAAPLAASQDKRIQAVVTEDGVPAFDYEPLERPVMLFASPSFFEMTGLSEFPSLGVNYVVWSDNFEHLSFADDPIWPAPMPMIGSLDGMRTVQIVRAYVLAFFDKYLKGEDSGLLDGPSDDYPEIEIRSQNTE